jgi:hypothetical protein
MTAEPNQQIAEIPPEKIDSQSSTCASHTCLTNLGGADGRQQVRWGGSRDVTLFAIETQAELEAIRQAMARPREPAQAPTTHARPDPDRGFV